MSPSERDPCPDCILDSAGSTWYFLKGLRNSPNGTRLTGGIESVRMNVPRLAGSFAVWGGLYSAMDCTMVFVRRKEDPWNSIIAGAATGGILSLREGLRAAGRSALFVGALCAFMDGASLMHSRVVAEQQNLPPLPADNPNLDATVAAEEGGLPSRVGSWIGSPFGKEVEVKKTNDTVSKNLESFETPSPPIPSFEYK
ncbi:hypothetical protein BRADI_1g22025v3 [Brachypodium distachyon]|uniref:Uncharacterized protein n=1 Tax=Brachypodium distachyon TaxID=15368 RepID=A0A0Q3JTF7_BRADI|nr:hypothetical protein BRADI_1g22025v3 [Brachypodium distachyon]